MDPVLAQLFAADPSLAVQAGVPLASVPEGGPLPVDPSGVPYAVQDFTAGPSPTAPAPAPVSPPQVPQQLPAGPQGVAPGESRSSSGLNLNTLESLRQTPDTKRQDLRAGAMSDRVGQNLADYQGDLGGIQSRAAGNIQTQGDLAANKAADMAEAAQKTARQEMAAARDIQSINDAAWSNVARSQADFQQQLAAQRAMRIDPNDWYTSRSDGQRTQDGISAAVAMYWMASGKPAMAEVGKMMMGNFQKSVERNIDAQVSNLKNQADVSDGFRQAWAMASQNATSEVEAKARVTAMLIQSHKDALAADIGAKYDSDLARSGAEAMMIEMDKGILDLAHKATQEAEKSSMDLAKVQSNEYIARMNNARAMESHALARDKFNAEAAAAKLKPYDDKLLIADPETGERRFKAKSEDSAKNADEAAVGAQNFQDAMAELTTALRASDYRSLGGATNLNMLKDSDDRAVSALAHRAAMMYAKILDPGGKVSDKDYVSNLAAGIPVAGLMDRATGEQGTQKVRELSVKALRNTIAQYATDLDPNSLPPEVARYGAGKGPNAPKGAQEGALAESTAKAAVTTRLDKAAGVFETPDARNTEWVPFEEADDRWRIYTAQKKGLKIDGETPVRKGGGSTIVKQPGWADEMSDMSLMANDPDLSAAQRVQARSKLEEIKKMKAKGTEDNVDAAYFAKWLLDGK